MWYSSHVVLLPQVATASGQDALRTTASAMRWYLYVLCVCVCVCVCGERERENLCLSVTVVLSNQAKIPCSALCRCIGCQNLPDKPENKSLMQLADAAGSPSSLSLPPSLPSSFPPSLLLSLPPSSAHSLSHLLLCSDMRTQQQAAATSHLLETLELTPVRLEPCSKAGQR